MFHLIFRLYTDTYYDVFDNEALLYTAVVWLVNKTHTYEKKPSSIIAALTISSNYPWKMSKAGIYVCVCVT